MTAFIYESCRFIVCDLATLLSKGRPNVERRSEAQEHPDTQPLAQPQQRFPGTLAGQEPRGTRNGGRDSESPPQAWSAGFSSSRTKHTKPYYCQVVLRLRLSLHA